MTTSTKTPNRLINEKSPYLLQHVDNPVDWYPWGEAAFEAARATDKPIFLSIGYSTCHWCHVMAHESFEDEEAARALNDAFVAVKLDREERPDVDAVYMQACMAMNGSGGWPLTVLMTADGKPFFAGTYFTKPQLLRLISRTAHLWQQDRESLLKAGDTLTQSLTHAQAEARTPDKALIARGVAELKRSFSMREGGFGGPPRFPMPHNLLLLIDHARAANDPDALRMAEIQLTQMFRGGIFDHLGGGFSRYATDRRWLIPHFEKMLYDNALLLYAYAEAFARTGRPVYRTVALRTVDYVTKELTVPEGGFMSAQDADAEGSEGAYYVFARGEAERVAGRALCDWYGVTEDGNFEGKNILNLLDNAGWEHEPDSLAAARAALYAHRAGRMKLGTDHKVLSAWNGLMIAGLARAGRAFHDARCIEAATNAWAFVQEHLLDADGALSIRWAGGEAAGEGLLDDYAFLSWGLLELYRSTYDLTLLLWAERLAQVMLLRFGGEGGLYLNAKDAGLIHRPMEFYDGAVPSGNAVAGHVLSELMRYTGSPSLRDAATKQMRALGAHAHAQPSAHAFTLWAMGRYLAEANDLLCACGDADSLQEAIGEAVKADDRALYVLIKTPENGSVLEALAPFTRDTPVPGSGALYYPCKEGACQLPRNTFHA